MPVVDNVTGEFLPTTISALQDTLAQHLVAPVLWEQGMRRMIGEGVDRFLEVGFGDMLSKFGFFIDRTRKHVPSLKLV